jgi:hypothetical protein
MGHLWIVSVDGESNGLGGDIFAIGAVAACVDTETGRVANNQPSYYGRCPFEPSVDIDPFVVREVLPVQPNLGRDLSQREMYDRFWQWLKPCLVDDQAKILVDVGFPVEARLFTDLITIDRSRAWLLNPPVIDLANMLCSYGFDGFDVDRIAWARETFGPVQWKRHNPTDDAWMQLGAMLTLGRKHPVLWKSPTFRPARETT